MKECSEKVALERPDIATRTQRKFEQKDGVKRGDTSNDQACQKHVSEKGASRSIMNGWYDACHVAEDSG